MRVMGVIKEMKRVIFFYKAVFLCDCKFEPTFSHSVELTSNCNIHIIKYNNKAYVLSGEISSLLWEKDLLRGMVRHQGHLRVNLDDVVGPLAEVN